MSRFSRITIDTAIEVLVRDILHESGNNQTKFERFLMYFELEQVVPYTEWSIDSRITTFLRYIYTHQDEQGPLGANLIFEIIEYITEKAVQLGIDDTNFQKLVNYLKRNGYKVDDEGKLVRIMPETMQIAEKEDEIHRLLDKFGFDIAKGHLEQAIRSFTRDDWAGSNAQLRSFIESLFDSIAAKLGVNLASTSSSTRWEALSQLNPPFFSPHLNEWRLNSRDNKEMFVRGFFNRLHPQGSHPGLSDEDDCTFRHYLVTIVSWHYLRRLDNRI